MLLNNCFTLLYDEGLKALYVVFNSIHPIKVCINFFRHPVETNRVLSGRNSGIIRNPISDFTNNMSH